LTNYDNYDIIEAKISILFHHTQSSLKMKNFSLNLSALLIIILSLGFNLSAQSKKDSKNNKNKENQFIQVGDKKIDINQIDISQMSKREYKQLIKKATYYQARLLIQKDLKDWEIRIDKAIADSSMIIKKEFKSIRRTKVNLHTGVDYRPVYHKIIEEALKRSDNPRKVLRFENRLKEFFAKNGKRF
jgi:uncharacterized protein (DUF2344 family)